MFPLGKNKVTSSLVPQMKWGKVKPMVSNPFEGWFRLPSRPSPPLAESPERVLWLLSLSEHFSLRTSIPGAIWYNPPLFESYLSNIWILFWMKTRGSLFWLIFASWHLWTSTLLCFKRENALILANSKTWSLCFIYFMGLIGFRDYCVYFLSFELLL